MGTATPGSRANADQGPWGQKHEKHASSRKREDKLRFCKEDGSWRRRGSSKKEEVLERY